MKTNTSRTALFSSLLSATWVCLLAAIAPSPVQALTTNLTAYSYARYDAAGADIGYTCYNIIPNGNYMTGLVGAEDPADYREYRTVWQFQIDTLGITPDQVASASVNWTGNPIWGGYKLGIDYVPSDFTTWNTIPMYGGGSLITNYKWNGSGANDCTPYFKDALAVATPTKGFALRFYCDGTPGDYVGGGISAVNIDVVVTPSVAPTNLVIQLADISGVKNAILTGSGGSGASGYSVLTTTNLTVPLTNWTTLATGQPFGVDGSLSFTNVVDLGTNALFYGIRVP